MILRNKIALVTGGSQGIGKAISEKLCAAGAAVAIAALDDQALKLVSAEFQSQGLKFKTYTGQAIDVSAGYGFRIGN